MSTIISKLQYKNQDFVPVSVADAVVVNGKDIPGLTNVGITTLDKVLKALYTLAGTNIADINALNTALNKISAGDGISIAQVPDNPSEPDGSKHLVIGLDPEKKYKLYQLETTLPKASADVTNKIYLIPVVENNETKGCDEYVCLGSEETGYRWEKIGSIITDLDLSALTARVTTLENNKITVIPITVDNTIVLVDYEINNSLWVK